MFPRSEIPEPEKRAFPIEVRKKIVDPAKKVEPKVRRFKIIYDEGEKEKAEEKKSHLSKISNIEIERDENREKSKKYVGFFEKMWGADDGTRAHFLDRDGNLLRSFDIKEIDGIRPLQLRENKIRFNQNWLDACREKLDATGEDLEINYPELYSQFIARRDSGNPRVYFLDRENCVIQHFPVKKFRGISPLNRGKFNQNWIDELREKIGDENGIQIKKGKYPKLFFQRSARGDLKHREEFEFKNVFAEIKKNSQKEMHFESKLRTRLEISRRIFLKSEILPPQIAVDLAAGIPGLESHFDLKKRSSAGARGPFQFLRETADRYGLKNREKFVDAARAARRYFEKLYLDAIRDPSFNQVLEKFPMGKKSENDLVFGLIAAAYFAGDRKIGPILAQVRKLEIPRNLRGRDLFLFLTQSYRHSDPEDNFGKNSRNYPFQVLAVKNLIENKFPLGEEMEDAILKERLSRIKEARDAGFSTEREFLISKVEKEQMEKISQFFSREIVVTNKVKNYALQVFRADGEKLIDISNQKEFKSASIMKLFTAYNYYKTLKEKGLLEKKQETNFFLKDGNLYLQGNFSFLTTQNFENEIGTDLVKNNVKTIKQIYLVDDGNRIEIPGEGGKYNLESSICVNGKTLHSTVAKEVIRLLKEKCGVKVSNPGFKLVNKIPSDAESFSVEESFTPLKLITETLRTSDNDKTNFILLRTAFAAKHTSGVAFQFDKNYIFQEGLGLLNSKENFPSGYSDAVEGSGVFFASSANFDGELVPLSDVHNLMEQYRDDWILRDALPIPEKFSEDRVFLPGKTGEVKYERHAAFFYHNYIVLLFLSDKKIDGGKLRYLRNRTAMQLD